MRLSASSARPGVLLRALCMVLFTAPIMACAQEHHRLSWAVDGALVGSGVAFHGIACIQAQRPMPLWTGALDPKALPAMDRGAVGRWDPAAHRASKVLFGVSLAASLATAWRTADGDRPLVPAVIVLESGFLSSGITGLVKETVQRPRPYLYDPVTLEGIRDDRDDHHAFWSGHTAHTAAITFATANIVQRSEASKGVKTATWIGAATLPAAMGWLRVRSGRHFPTDVLTGYAFGALVGWAVPYLHRPKSNKRTHEK